MLDLHDVQINSYIDERNDSFLIKVKARKDGKKYGFVIRFSEEMAAALVSTLVTKEEYVLPEGAEYPHRVLDNEIIGLML